MVDQPLGSRPVLVAVILAFSGAGGEPVLRWPSDDDMRNDWALGD